MIVEIDGHIYNTDLIKIKSHGHLVEICETTHHLQSLSCIEGDSLSDSTTINLVGRIEDEDDG